MNKVTLLGRLTRDPEIRYTQSAEPLCVAKYTLAVGRRFKRNGEPDADFIPCVAFGKTGEFAEKYCKKGKQIAIIGRIQVRTYDDNNNQKHWVTEIVVEEHYFANSNGQGAIDRGASPGNPADNPGHTPEDGRGDYTVMDDDGELPF